MHTGKLRSGTAERHDLLVVEKAGAVLMFKIEAVKRGIGLQENREVRSGADINFTGQAKIG